MTTTDSYQPEMFGDRIWLRPIELRDALAVSLASEVDIDAHNPGRIIPTSETAFRAWISSLGDDELVWAVCRTDENEAIGTASIRKIDLAMETAETGMSMLDEVDRGKGYGQEVKKLIFDFAFEVMGLHTLICTIDARNERSKRSVEKSGYSEVGSLTADVPIGLGDYTDTLIFQIMAAEWRAGR